MASASFGESEDDVISNRGHRVNGYDIVYTRRTGKKVKKLVREGDDDAACTTSEAENPAPVISSIPETEGSSVLGCVTDPSATGQNGHSEAANRDEDNFDELPQQHVPSLKDEGRSEEYAAEKNDLRGNLSESNGPDNHDLCSIQNLDQKDCLNGALVPNLSQGERGEGLVDGGGFEEPLFMSSSGEVIRFRLGRRSSRVEVGDLNQKLENELESVRRMLKQFETKEHQLVSSDGQYRNNKYTSNGSFKDSEALNNVKYFQSQPQQQPDLPHRKVFLRVNTDMASAVKHEGRSLGLSRVSSDVGIQRNPGPRSYNRQLSVAVLETNHRHGEYAEKEKRTPKANQFYRNTEFLLSKDRLPPESNKRLKTGSGRNTENAFRLGLGFDKGRNQLFRNCSSLLHRLMKHKFGWVFNVPVDANQLGLVDYHDIIKHPMDLGTIKGRLAQNWYKSPLEFAEDVRLVFRNAMTYNPKGQDVHIMAEQLLHIFEERWSVIEVEYNDYCKYQLYKDGRLPATASRRPPDQPYFSPSSFTASAPAQSDPYSYASLSPHIPDGSQTRPIDRREPLSTSAAGIPRTPRSHFGRAPASRKPKAKDLNKRDMTQDEKQKLSKHLQELPMDKLDAIVQIIKKRNTALSQHDDEIEVDIDSVDPETLWELDRFVSNYKKRLSKNKRKAELALQARTAAGQSAATAGSAPAITAIKMESGGFEKSISPAEGQKGDAYNDSSSSSSSSDSGSSSSDSDSDSSSGDGSHSPGT